MYQFVRASATLVRLTSMFKCTPATDLNIGDQTSELVAIAPLRCLNFGCLNGPLIQTSDTHIHLSERPIFEGLLPTNWYIYTLPKIITLHSFELTPEEPWA